MIDPAGMTDTWLEGSEGGRSTATIHYNTCAALVVDPPTRTVVALPANDSRRRLLSEAVEIACIFSAGISLLQSNLK